MPDLIRVYSRPILGLKLENERYGCSMFAAMATGSKEAVKALLKGSVMQPVEDQDYEDYTRSCHEECNQTKIGRNFTFSRHRTIFSYSAEFGYKNTISSILCKGIREEGDCIVYLEVRADELMKHLISGELTNYRVVRNSPEPLHPGKGRCRCQLEGPERADTAMVGGTEWKRGGSQDVANTVLSLATTSRENSRPALALTLS
jgi:hypothetical protein